MPAKKYNHHSETRRVWLLKQPTMVHAVTATAATTAWLACLQTNKHSSICSSTGACTKPQQQPAAHTDALQGL
jgi:hypothetical protein